MAAVQLQLYNLCITGYFNITHIKLFFCWPPKKQHLNVAVAYCDNLHNFTALGGKCCGRFCLRNLKRNMAAAEVHDQNGTSNSRFSLNSVKSPPSLLLSYQLFLTSLTPYSDVENVLRNRPSCTSSLSGTLKQSVRICVFVANRGWTVWQNTVDMGHKRLGEAIYLTRPPNADLWPPGCARKARGYRWMCAWKRAKKSRNLGILS